jgi:hypothetical protein
MAKRFLACLVLAWAFVGDPSVSAVDFPCDCAAAFNGYDSGNNFVAYFENSHSGMAPSEFGCAVNVCTNWWNAWFAQACSVHGLAYGTSGYSGYNWAGLGWQYGPFNMTCP